MSFATWSILMYTRFDAPSLLEHEVRRGLVERLRGEPGLSLLDAARALDVHYSTVRHHVRMLERAGHVVLVTDSRARLYLPGSERRRASAPLPPRVLRALGAVRDGAATPAELGRALDIPRGSAGRLLAALERAGLATRDGSRWRVTERVGEHLSPAGPEDGMRLT